MSRSYPYNVVVTRDPLVLEKLFFDKFGRTSFSDVFSRLNADEKTNALVVSPRSNNNFISLDVNFPDKVSGGGTKYVTLKLLETSKLLEYFNLSTNAFTELLVSRAQVRKAVLGPGRVIDDLAKGLRPRFYLSFGMGDDVQEWSGPYNLQLIDANISITSDGVRELELMFSPNTESLLVFTNKLFNDYQHGQEDSIFDTAAKDLMTIRSVENYKLKENKQANQPEAGWNYCVRGIVSKFISERFPTVPNGNTLVLIPDDFRDFLTIANPEGKTIDVAFEKKLNDFGIDISLDYERVFKKKKEAHLKITEDAEKVIKNKSTKLIKLRKDKKDLELRIAKAVERVGQIAYRQLDIQSYVRKLEKINSLIPEYEQGIRMGVAGSPRLHPAYKGDMIWTDVGPIESEPFNSNVDGNAVPDFDPSKYTHFNLGMGGSVFSEWRVVDMANTLEVLAPLYTFIKGVYGVNGQERTEDFTILEENDAKILKLLKKYELIESAESPVIIFGRLSTIKELVYPDSAVAAEGAASNLNAASEEEIEAFRGVGEGLRSQPRTLGGAMSQKRIGTAALDRLVEAKSALREVQSRLGFLSDVNWVDYAKDFVETFKLKGIKTSSFGEGFGSNTSMIKDLIPRTNSDNPLIFTHNIKNSNVLSLSFDSSPYKGQLLNYSTESVYKVLDGVFPQGEIVKNDGFQVGPLAKLIVMAAKDVKAADPSNNTVDVQAIIKKTLSTASAGKQLKLLATPNGSQTNDVGAATFFDSVLLKAMSYSRNVVRKVGLGQTSTAEAEILRKMNKAIINVDIKTLPFFNTPTLPGRKCVLFGKPNLIRGATELRGRIEHEPAFYTNAYTIIGYKHRITPTDAYSEFKLIQDSFAQGATIPNQSMALFFEKEIKEAIQRAEGRYRGTPEEVAAQKKIAENLSWWEMGKNLFSSMLGSG